MTNPLHASYYADRAVQQTAEVIENREIARDTFRIRLRSPEVAARITPGQFIMVKLHGFDDPLIGRPLALYDVIYEGGRPDAVDVVYLVKGKLTSRLCHVTAGQSVDLWGPSGNGFPAQPARHLIMVAGGIGQTPFLALGKEYLGSAHFGERQVPAASRVSLCYGARTAEYLAGLDDFEQAGIELHLATDDGTRGHHGLVTEVLNELLDKQESLERTEVLVVCCGPEPMMQAVAELTIARGVECLVSLETPMACGIGICFTCVARIRETDQAAHMGQATQTVHESHTGSWDYKRTCVEGPVFDARQIQWTD